MSDLVTIATTLAQTMTAYDTTDAGLIAVGKGVAYGVAAGGAGVGIGLVVAATLNGIARQPEQGGALRGLMFLGIGFIEALALIGFVLVFILK